MERTDQAVSVFSVFPGQQRISQACATQWGEGEKYQMSINLSTVDLRVWENKLGHGSPLGSLRDTHTHIIYTTGVHVFLLLIAWFERQHSTFGPHRKASMWYHVSWACVRSPRRSDDRKTKHKSEMQRSRKQCKRGAHVTVQLSRKITAWCLNCEWCISFLIVI